MIPKIIHYCWLSDEPIPVNLQRYIDGWHKLMPDYTFKKWDKKAFDIHSVKWVEDAYANRKWAFAADYIRAYALYTEGGFYLDSDVDVKKRLDPFLDNGFVSSIEYVPSRKSLILNQTTGDGKRKQDVDSVSGLGIQAAIIGGEKGHAFFNKLLDYYNSNSFMLEDGKLNQTPAPAIYAKILEDSGFSYRDIEQKLEDRIHIYPSSVFAGYQTSTFSSVAVHMCAGSWTDSVGGGTAKSSEEKYISPESTKSFISKASGIKGNNVMEDNIPKIIHYFWFGGNPMPPLAEKCIASWKQYLPDYKIKRWDESNFDVNCIDYVAEAYKAKKYAFVSDYARLLILYKYGGLYFDTDVEVIHNMYDIVANGPFFAIENQILHLVKINPGLVMGAYKEMPFLKDVVDSYDTDHFLLPDGNYNLTTINDRVTKMLSKLGWKADDRTQRVCDFTIYSSEFFCPYHARTERMHLTPNSKAIHWYAGSWVDKNGWNPRKLKHIAKMMIPERILGWWLERKM